MLDPAPDGVSAGIRHPQGRNRPDADIGMPPPATIDELSKSQARGPWRSFGTRQGELRDDEGHQKLTMRQ
jgi:hypothetical protein